MSQEERILEQYEPMLKGIVKDFRRRCSCPDTDEQDLMQEARIAFLSHIRGHDEQEYGKVYRTILHALYEAVRRNYPLSISYHGFSKSRRTSIKTISIEEEEGQLLSLQTDDAAQWLVMFLHSLKAQEQMMVNYKLDGLTNKEIASRMGVSDATISRRFHQIRMQWD